jgi:prephenate dehydrogenase
MNTLPLQQVTIVGPGLLGGSVGLALRHAGFTGRIIGCGRRTATLDRAEARQCIDCGTTDLAEGVRGSDLILLAAPLGSLPTLLEKLGELDLGDAVVTDVGSTKRRVAGVAERALRRPGRFVGSHPMAGSEQQGPDAARPGLFRDRPVILTPAETTEPEAVQRVEQLWRIFGMRVYRMDGAEHDRLVARISHLPHAVAVLLALLAERGGEDALEVASTGFGDTTRIAAGDPELWADIFLDNREAVTAVLGEWSELFERFRAALESDDRASLLAMLHSAQRTRDRWASLHPEDAPRQQQQADESPGGE